MATGRRCFILKILYNQVLKLGKFVGIQRKGVVSIELQALFRGGAPGLLSHWSMRLLILGSRV